MNQQISPSILEPKKVLIGKPAAKVDENVVSAVIEALSRVPECMEAHLPQVFALGAMPAPRLTLVVVVGDAHDVELIARRLNDEITKKLPASSIDTWILSPSDSLLPAVRKAQCALI